MSTEGFDPSASSSQAEGPDPMIGQVVDRYRIVDRLGEGGMGEVYAAKHVHIEKRVALKLLRKEILTNEEAVKRFRQEAQSASSIGHTNIIRIEDFGSLDDGRIFLAMELLEGQPLNDLIHESLPHARLLNILIQTGHGLAAAHAKGIVHRDMKPENIFVTRGAMGEDVPKLLDFGIAKVASGEGNNHLTRTGTIFGTPFYMAPEQALGQVVDHRADIYAMGVIIYECFCGAVPFEGDSFMGILTQHITAEPKSPSTTAYEHQRSLPPGLEEIIIRTMKKEPEDRYQTMDELVQALVGVYRGVAGSGMSTYMEAHRPPPRSETMMAPNPPPPSAQYSAHVPVMAQTPVPVHPHADQSQPIAVPPMGLGASPSVSMEVPKKSKAGLIAAIITALAVIGGGAAFLVLSMNKDEGGAGGSAAGGSGQAGVVADAGQAGTGGAIDASGTTAADKPIDAGAAVATGTIDAAATGGDPVAEKVVVLLDSLPRAATVTVGGKKLKNKTPTQVELTVGEPLTVVLGKRGYKDLEMTIDGTEKTVRAHLEKKRGSSGSGEDKPPSDPCKKNPNLPQCWLED